MQLGSEKFEMGFALINQILDVHEYAFQQVRYRRCAQQNISPSKCKKPSTGLGFLDRVFS